ncbi:cobyrinate a,c-diamide synthase [Desulfocurvus sp. DL9XJH121]
MPRTIVIAGTHSGCGKTTAALALMAALVRRGLTVQPFKAGPDFIDPGHHEAVTGRPSHNLDGWMMGEAGVREVFARYAADADVAVVEGVMGLFDGFSGTTEDGSTAQLAKWLGASVVLVVDARSMARSAAALVKGYAEFDPDLAVAGALFNRTGSDNHRALIADAMLALPHVPALGYLPRDEALALPSRHLGLVTAEDHPLGREAADRLAAWLEAGAEVGRVLSLAPEMSCVMPCAPPYGRTPKPPSVRIGLARDAAFCFYYRENLRLLEAAGAELVPFSPLADADLPPDLAGLYLGGGYPELFATKLAANASMRGAVRAFSLAGRPVYAECGGFMYLMESLADQAGAEHPMAGVFPLRAAMNDRFRALGYREVVTQEPCPLGPAWTMLRGHEFHYSSVSGGEDAPCVYKVMDRTGWTGQREGWLANKTLGTYVHAHFTSNPDAAAAFVAACAEAR